MQLTGKLLQLVCPKTGTRALPLFFERGFTEFYEQILEYSKNYDFAEFREQLVLVLNEYDGNQCLYSLLPVMSIGRIFDLMAAGSPEPSSPFFPQESN